MTEPTASPDATDESMIRFLIELADNGVATAVLTDDLKYISAALTELLALRQEVERLREVLAIAEAVMSIVEPRSDKPQYVATIEKMRLALQPKEN